jgi:hypothetical protein
MASWLVPQPATGSQQAIQISSEQLTEQLEEAFLELSRQASPGDLACRDVEAMARDHLAGIEAPD